MTFDASTKVAPPAGAWIETLGRPRPCGSLPVAPPAGAWIETCHTWPVPEDQQVAPPAGAWIETIEDNQILLTLESRPLRARGLKQRRAVASEKG